MSIISEKFNSKINALKSAFEENKEIEHQGIKGGLNEIELSSLIKDIIPKKYRITKGIIENSNGEQSNETDVLIYDDEILPPYIKNELTFVPVEAVKYIFEVKSILNSTELKTTIKKFENYKSIGGRSPTVLFAFSSDINGSELLRYYKNDTNFFTNPAITVLCSSNKSYYYKHVEEHYLKDHLSASDFINNFSKSIGLEDSADHFPSLRKNSHTLDQMTRSEFAALIETSIKIKDSIRNLDNEKLTVNGIRYSEIKYKIHKWIGVESPDNNVDLCFLSGISNTLSKQSFGSYLLNKKEIEYKTLAICCEDMWGNISCQDFDKLGLNYDTNKFKFNFESNHESHKITFTVDK
ncbi:DUF6602 domain-containing protein [Castellaniella sp. MT123]|uniref:DUF6602 domain-containing protein n=1 Tax=Castellaniella sp. MT123 TaxID=3140381 RepID=UPI0031F3F7A1